MKNKKSSLYWLSIIVIGIAVGITLQFVRAWTEPGAAPPSGNVPAPINTGSIDQNKGGRIFAADFCLSSDNNWCLSNRGAGTGSGTGPCECDDPTGWSGSKMSCGSIYQDFSRCNYICGGMNGIDHGHTYPDIYTCRNSEWQLSTSAICICVPSMSGG